MSAPRAKLIGWLEPPREGPGFVIPLLQYGLGNIVLAQQLDEDDHVVDLYDLDPPNFTPVALQTNVTLAIGEPALWAYVFPGEPAQIANRAQLATWLAPRIDEITDPLRKLQAVEFCEIGPQMRDAWRAAYTQLATYAPASANVWRDLIAIPMRMRQAVHRAILDYQLDLSTHDLGQKVGAAIRGEGVDLILAPDIHAALLKTPRAFDQITRQTAAVREAFGLSQTIGAFPSEVTLAASVDELDIALAEPIVVAIGPLAIETLGQTLPRSETRGWRITRGSDGDPGTPISLLMTNGAELLHSGDCAIDDIAPLLADVVGDARAEIVFLFALKEREEGIVHSACRLAGRLGRDRIRVIAVIPHLPDMPLVKPFGPWLAMQKEIAETFDGICFLSDQSPLMRSSTAFGPARSVQAVSERLAMLLAKLEQETLTLSPPDSAHGVRGTRVDVFSSASDTRLGVPPLIEHALGRAMDPSFDIKGMDTAMIIATQSFRPDQVEVAHRLLGQEGAKAIELSIDAVPTTRRQRRQIHLQLSGVSWIAPDMVDYLGYCRAILEQAGWSVGQSSGPHCILLAQRKDQTIDLALSPTLSPEFPDGERGKGRTTSPDCVVVTQVPVRRASYAEHLLRGWMPIHFSRLRMLGEVFERRYATLIASMQQPNQRMIDRLQRAAFRQLQLRSQHWLEDQKTEGPASQWLWSTQRGRDASVEILRDGIRIDLAVERRHAYPGAVRQPQRAMIVLTYNGWEVAQVIED